MSTLRDKLKSLGGNWSSAPKENKFERLPAGDYEGVITEVELTESQAGNPMVKLTLGITVPPELEGRNEWDNIVLTEDSMKFARPKLAMLGVDVEDLEELPEVLETLQGKSVKWRTTYKPNKDDPDDEPNKRIRFRSEVEENSELEVKPAKKSKKSSDPTQKKGKKF